MTHTQIAAHVHEKFGVSGWWSQTVTVGYERIKGLREIGQRLSGTYEASKSRTFPVAAEMLFEYFDDARKRKRWLPEAGVKVRKSSAPKSMRITWPDSTSVEVWFTPKGDAKSSVATTFETTWYSYLRLLYTWISPTTNSRGVPRSKAREASCSYRLEAIAGRCGAIRRSPM